jgi:hypothetical protein
MAPLVIPSWPSSNAICNSIDTIPVASGRRAALHAGRR